MTKIKREVLLTGPSDTGKMIVIYWCPCLDTAKPHPNCIARREWSKVTPR